MSKTVSLMSEIANRVISCNDAVKARADRDFCEILINPYDGAYSERMKVAADLWHCRVCELTGQLDLCPTCGAVGPDSGDCMSCGTSLAETEMVCPDCNGLGGVPIEGTYEFGQWDFYPCYRCKGEGTVDAKFLDLAKEFRQAKVLGY